MEFPDFVRRDPECVALEALVDEVVARAEVLVEAAMKLACRYPAEVVGPDESFHGIKVGPGEFIGCLKAGARCSSISLGLFDSSYSQILGSREFYRHGLCDSKWIGEFENNVMHVGMSSGRYGIRKGRFGDFFLLKGKYKNGGCLFEGSYSLERRIENGMIQHDFVSHTTFYFTETDGVFTTRGMIVTRDSENKYVVMLRAGRFVGWDCQGLNYRGVEGPKIVLGTKYDEGFPVERGMFHLAGGDIVWGSRGDERGIFRNKKLIFPTKDMCMMILVLREVARWLPKQIVDKMVAMGLSHVLHGLHQ